MSFEASRKHGVFDGRWRVGSAGGAATAPALADADAVEGLDWDSFASRRPAARRRHDLAAVAAYGAYTRGHDWEDSEPPPRPTLRLVPDAPDSLVAEVEPPPAVAVVADLLVWESEGGSALEPRET